MADAVVPIDAELAAALKAQFPALQEDAAAHRAEHAAEVGPLSSVEAARAEIVPIALGTGQFETLEQLGKVWPTSLRRRGSVLIVASSGMKPLRSDVVAGEDHRAD